MELYIPHSQIDALPVRITFTKIWDESSVLSSLINDNQKDDKEQYLIYAELIINGHVIQPGKWMRNFKKSTLHDEAITFPAQYRELSYNSMIAITLYSSQKQFNQRSPLASTTLPLFDQNLVLREGKVNLLLWPNVTPDISSQSKTPGLVTDKNIETLNYCTQKIESIEQNQSDTNQNLSLSNLRLKLFYCYKTIPAAFLEINLPRFSSQVLYEDIQYQLDEIGQSILGGGFNNGLIQDSVQQQKSKLFIPQNGFSDCFIISDYDYEFGREDPVQEMINAQLRHDEHPETNKPDRQRSEIMLKAMLRPIVGEMKEQDKQLFWIYRYWSMQYGQALPRFLSSVKWDTKQEEEEAIKLMTQWASIDIEDALFLLSWQFCANNFFKKCKRPRESMVKVRKLAVQALEQFSDDKIESVLLQLVAAIKYEYFDDQVKSDLCMFLFKRASNNKTLATYLYWYLNVEQDAPTKEAKNKVTEWYKEVFNQFCTLLQDSQTKLWDIVTKQFEFRRKLQSLSKMVRELRGERASKIAQMRNKLGESEFQDIDLLPEHPSCLDPDITVQQAVPASCSIFSSAMAPMKLTFKALKNNKQHEFNVMFKNGDDLRQDQLVMQIFNLMNALLKGVSQDMKLLPYKILACSKSDGFLEFVPRTQTLQDILKQMPILQHLKALSENPSNPFYIEQINQTGDPAIDEQNIKLLIEEQLRNTKYGINPQIMSNYILSSAGYCVLTYFLGIGDRHLENLLINNEGKMFHIDFGFILGKDPKPYPPPFKLCKAMVEGMGGEYSEFYTLFKQKCVDVYIYLRKYAKLIINLFVLMTDAGIKDYSQEAIENMYEKFRLDDNDEAAEIHFLGIIEASTSAQFARITDITHGWVSYWRGK